MPRHKIHCTTNGLAPAFLRDPGRNEPERAIYASCPARGLAEVLETWPSIRRAVPAATLDVYHGFTAGYEAMAVHYPGLHIIKEKVLRLLDQDQRPVSGHLHVALGLGEADAFGFRPVQAQLGRVEHGQDRLVMGQDAD